MYTGNKECFGGSEEITLPRAKAEVAFRCPGEMHKCRYPLGVSRKNVHIGIAERAM